jgi:hypothetical protein
LRLSSRGYPDFNEVVGCFLSPPHPARAVASSIPAQAAAKYLLIFFIIIPPLIQMKKFIINPAFVAFCCFLSIGLGINFTLAETYRNSNKNNPAANRR